VQDLKGKTAFVTGAASGIGLGSEQLQQGLDLLIVGELVIEASQADRMHIFTDPRMAAAVAERFAGIAEDFESAANSNILKRIRAPGT
jgi:NAD(P)-dependent dehydrogenase (short-subunit alcohol dehydrogenase family)